MADGEKIDTGYVVLRSDRRKASRRQMLVLRVRGEDGRGVFFGYARVLGKGGMFISSVNPRAVGEEFDLSFTSPDRQMPFDIRCRCAVVWTMQFDPERKTEPGMGVKFLDLGEEEKKSIEEWVNKKA